MPEVYRKQGITLHHGDNVEVMQEMPADSIDLVVTSPPYDNLRTYGGHSWDFEGVAQQLWRLIKPGGVVVWVVNDATVDGSETGTSFRQALRFKEIGFRLHDTMIWESDKPPLTHNRYEQSWEFMFVFSNGKPTTWNPLLRKTKWAGKPRSGTFIHSPGASYKPANTKTPTADSFIRKNVWSYPTGSSGSFGHPAPFPEALARDHIHSWSNEGDTVLDPFCGSGTTMKIARDMGRLGIGIEVNQEYIDIQKQRLAQKILFGMEASIA